MTWFGATASWPRPDRNRTSLSSVFDCTALGVGRTVSPRPASASPLLAGWFAAWERHLDDHGRRSLGCYDERLARSRGTAGQEVARQWMVLDWLVGVAAPIWLRAAGLGGQAARLAHTPAVNTPARVAATLGPARDAARAAELALDATWREVARITQPRAERTTRSPLRPLDDPGADLTAARNALGEGVRTAIAASQPTVVPALAALRFDVEPTRAPQAWDALSRAVDHAKATVGWAGVYRRLRRADWTWRTAPAEACQQGWAAARGHLRPVEVACERSAHVLVRQLLAVGEPGGGEVTIVRCPRDAW